MKELEKRLGGDLEQIALFSLPSMIGNANSFDDDDDDDEDDEILLFSLVIFDTMTSDFQLLSNDAFASLLRSLPQTEAREATEESKYGGTEINIYFRVLI